MMSNSDITTTKFSYIATSAWPSWDVLTIVAEGVSHEEELRLREENDLVKGLYEQYRVALILASGDDND